MAAKLGGHLVTVETSKEWEFLEKEFGIPLHENSVWSRGSNRIWIGGSPPGAARLESSPDPKNRRGQAPSIYTLQENLVYRTTSPASSSS